MAKLGLVVVCAIVLNLHMQTGGVPLMDISHVQLCKQSVSQLSHDMQYSKRDEDFVNLVVNLCFPGVNEETLLQLISTLSKLKPEAPSSTISSKDSSSDSAPSWDNGLIPEVGPGQEGVDELPNVIGNTLTETGPEHDQEVIQNVGKDVEETDNTGTDDVDQQANDLRDADNLLEERRMKLIDIVKAWFTNKIASLKEENGDKEQLARLLDTFNWLFGTTESPEEMVPTTTITSTTEKPIVTESQENEMTTASVESTTETDWSDAFDLLFGNEKRKEELIELLLRKNDF